MARKLRKNKLKRNVLIFLNAVFILLIIFLCVMIFKKSFQEDKEEEKKVSINLGNGLVITEIGSYTGTYMEDASDDEVEDVMMIKVTNNGEETLQYAEIILKDEEKESVFKLSTLMSGETIMVLEADRKSYSKNGKYTEAFVQYSVFFTEDLSKHDDILKIQPLDGGFNITNITDKDIAGEIIVYFKNYKEDILCGGITYRGRIENGLKAGETRQIMTENFTESETKVMFITIAGE